MNLSHVERYFADFLSVMESKDEFKLHSSEINLNLTDGDKFQKSIEMDNKLVRIQYATPKMIKKGRDVTPSRWCLLAPRLFYKFWTKMSPNWSPLGVLNFLHVKVSI